MNEIPVDLLRSIVSYISVSDALHFEHALHQRLYKKAYYMKRKEWEPLVNVIRLFKKGVFRTYRIVSYVKDGVTYTDVSVSPICRSFQCKHQFLVSPSVACHWVLSCISDGSKRGWGYIEYDNI